MHVFKRGGKVKTKREEKKGGEQRQGGRERVGKKGRIEENNKEKREHRQDAEKYTCTQNYVYIYQKIRTKNDNNVILKFVKNMENMKIKKIIKI